MEHITYPATDGSTLRTLREDAGVSQDDVAGRIGTTRHALRRWERNPRLPYVKAMAYRAALDNAVADKAERVA